MLNGTKIIKDSAKIIFKRDCLVRSKHTNEGPKLLGFGQKTSKSFHQSQIPSYPATQQLPLPVNIEDLACSEKSKFSSQRSRDINGSFIVASYQSSQSKETEINNLVDDATECYDCSGTVNLSSTTQTNVPYPFVSNGEPVHLNIIGCPGGKKDKYMSGDLNNVHHSNSQQTRNGTSVPFSYKSGKKNFRCDLSMDFNHFNCKCFDFSSLNRIQFRQFCTVKENVKNKEETLVDKEITKVNAPKLSRKEKLKIAVRDYGAVVIVFHVGISLLSLGCCYVIVSSGVDVSYILKTFGAGDGEGAAGTAANFVIAYAIHKTLAPGRIAITLTSVPFIVKKLRKIGILKTPPK